MPDRWVDVPPAPCHVTGRDQAKDDQPYLVEHFHYAAVTRGPDGAPRVLPRVLPLVHAASQIERVCQLPGSPFKLMRVKDYERWEKRLLEAQMAVEDMQARIAELESENSTLRNKGGPLDVEALTNNVVAQLRDHLPKRPGPKPKAAA